VVDANRPGAFARINPPEQTQPDVRGRREGNDPKETETRSEAHERHPALGIRIGELDALGVEGVRQVRKKRREQTIPFLFVNTHTTHLKLKASSTVGTDSGRDFADE
jgi:hypothetical protein